MSSSSSTAPPPKQTKIGSNVDFGLVDCNNIILSWIDARNQKLIDRQTGTSDAKVSISSSTSTNKNTREQCLVEELLMSIGTRLLSTSEMNDRVIKTLELDSQMGTTLDNSPTSPKSKKNTECHPELQGSRKFLSADAARKIADSKDIRRKKALSMLTDSAVELVLERVLDVSLNGGTTCYGDLHEVLLNARLGDEVLKSAAPLEISLRNANTNSTSKVGQDKKRRTSDVGLRGEGGLGSTLDDRDDTNTVNCDDHVLNSTNSRIDSNNSSTNIVITPDIVEFFRKNIRIRLKSLGYRIRFRFGSAGSEISAMHFPHSSAVTANPPDNFLQKSPWYQKKRISRHTEQQDSKSRRNSDIEHLSTEPGSSSSTATTPLDETEEDSNVLRNRKVATDAILKQDESSIGSIDNPISVSDKGIVTSSESVSNDEMCNYSSLHFQVSWDDFNPSDSNLKNQLKNLKSSCYGEFTDKLLDLIQYYASGLLNILPNPFKYLPNSNKGSRNYNLIMVFYALCIPGVLLILLKLLDYLFPHQVTHELEWLEQTLTACIVGIKALFQVVQFGTKAVMLLGLFCVFVIMNGF